MTDEEVMKYAGMWVRIKCPCFTACFRWECHGYLVGLQGNNFVFSIQFEYTIGGLNYYFLSMSAEHIWKIDFPTRPPNMKDPFITNQDLGLSSQVKLFKYRSQPFNNIPCPYCRGKAHMTATTFYCSNPECQGKL